MERETLNFRSVDADCAAWLLRPPGRGRAPVVVMAHGLGATRDMGLLPFAERFVAAGYACLVFDYRHFGDSGGEPRQLLSVRRQLEDWRAAIAFVRGRADVDSTRVVLWGTSFAGGHVLATAARDDGIAACIAQCPFTDGIASCLAMNPVTALRLTAAAVVDAVAGAFGARPRLVTTAGAPGDLALMTAPDVMAGYLALVPEQTKFRNEVAARIVLEIVRYRPGRDVADVRCPVQLCVCDDDSVAPAAATLRHADRGKQVEVRRYATGHFEIYRGEWFERVVADQVAFLARHVPPGGAHQES